MIGLHYVPKRLAGGGKRWYVYAWRGGPCIAQRDGWTRPRLSAAEMRAAMAAADALAKPDPALLVSLIREWEASPEWNSLADGTRKTWGSQLRAIEARWGDKPLSVWNFPQMTSKVVDWRDSRAETPRAADIGVTVLRELLKFGRLRGRVTFNAAADIPTLYRGDRAEIVWTDEDIERFSWYAIQYERPQLIDGIWLAGLTGLRRADLVTVRESNVYDFAIIKRALKVSKGKRRTATMPRIPELDALLEELRTRDRADGVDTLLVNSRGRPWSGDGFGGSFNRIRDKAEIEHVDEETGKRTPKTLHDLRGTFCTKLCLHTDLTNKEIAGIMAWSPERVDEIRRKYVDQSRIVVAIGERIASGTKRGPVNRSVNQPEGGDEN